MTRLPGSARTRDWTALGVLVVLAILAPLLLSQSSLRLTALFLPLALLAMSVDILWGENRIISFGHGAFFAAGGYIGGLILIGHTYNPISGAASFLEQGGSSSGLDRLLGHLHDISIAGLPVPALLVPPLVVGAIGLIIGMIVFRVTDPEIYLPLITLGITVVAGLWFNDVDGIGGSNGLGGIPSFTKDIAGGGTTVQYVFNAAFVVAALIGYAVFRQSQRGATWRALGDDAVRLEALGYPVRRIRAYGFAVSVAIAGLAGSLYAATAGVIGPGLADITFSAQPLIWVAVGGTGTLLGPVVGTLVVQWLQQLLSVDLGLQNSWQLFLGLALIFIVLLAPGGLLGSRREGILARLPRRRPPPSDGDRGAANADEAANEAVAASSGRDTIRSGGPRDA